MHKVDGGIIIVRQPLSDRVVSQLLFLYAEVAFDHRAGFFILLDQLAEPSVISRLKQSASLMIGDWHVAFSLQRDT